MCHRLTLLGLAAVLVLLPAMLEAPNVAAVPAPPRYPDVYALVYAGKDSNDAEGDKKVAMVIEEIREAIPEAWRKKIRITRLEGTAILRIWTTHGQPQERAHIINGALREYFGLNKAMSPLSRERREIYQSLHNLYTKEQAIKERLGGTEARNLEKFLRPTREKIRQAWERYDLLPRPLEWAAVKKIAGQDR